MTDTAPSIGWREFLSFISPAGQAQIAAFIQKAKDERGSGWLVEIKSEYPLFCWFAELVADRDADAAFTELQAAYETYPLWMVRGQVIGLHAWLRNEIEKPRG